MRLSIECRRKVIALCSRGYAVSVIRQRLQEENISISCQALHNLIWKFHEKRTVRDLPRRRRQWKITKEMRAVIEEAYNGNDELTSSDIKRLVDVDLPKAWEASNAHLMDKLLSPSIFKDLL